MALSHELGWFMTIPVDSPVLTLMAGLLIELHACTASEKKPAAHLIRATVVLFADGCQFDLVDLVATLNPS